MTSRQLDLITMLDPITERGQAVWYDDLSRELLEDGTLDRLIEQGVTGLTSNPTIFDNAISKSSRYDASIAALAEQGLSAADICESLFVEDVGAAADLLLPVYQETTGMDGYASLEVSPELADDYDGTLEAARRLWRKLDRQNVMIKIPATDVGVRAMKVLIKEGVNINMTLIFSTERYEQVARGYLEALRERAKAGEELVEVSSVASFFVSRLDAMVSKKLQQLGKDEALVEGRIAVANCRLAYEIFSNLQAESMDVIKLGAQTQRPLWASTSSKSARLKPTYYVEQLIAQETVNTMPPQTLQACLESLDPSSLLDMSVEQAQACIAELEEQGVKLSEVFEELTLDGVQKFVDSYRSLLSSIEAKCQQMRA